MASLSITILGTGASLKTRGMTTGVEFVKIDTTVSTIGGFTMADLTTTNAGVGSVEIFDSDGKRVMKSHETLQGKTETLRVALGALVLAGITIPPMTDPIVEGEQTFRDDEDETLKLFGVGAGNATQMASGIFKVKIAGRLSAKAGATDNFTGSVPFSNTFPILNVDGNGLIEWTIPFTSVFTP